MRKNTATSQLGGRPRGREKKKVNKTGALSAWSLQRCPPGFITVQWPLPLLTFLNILRCCCPPYQPIPDMAPGGSQSVCDGFEQTLHSANFLDFPRGRTLGEEGLVIYGKVVLGTQMYRHRPGICTQ